jgi:hypothetical protein
MNDNFYTDEQRKLKDQFVGYVGDPDFHDGSIREIHIDGNTAQVTVRGYSGNHYRVTFTGVESVVARRPHEVWLYALAEMRCNEPLRLFSFTNNEDEDNAMLEVVAGSIEVIRL